MFQVWYAATRLTRWRAPRARRSLSRDRADAKGAAVAPPCRGSTPTKPRLLECNSPEEPHFSILQIRSRFHLHEALPLIHELSRPWLTARPPLWHGDASLDRSNR